MPVQNARAAEQSAAAPAAGRLQEGAAFEEGSSLLGAEFLSNLAHQLRSPLSSLRVWVDLLKDPSATASLKDIDKLVDGIERATSRLERQITDILEAGYLEAGTLSITPRPVEMVTQVADAVESVEQSARSRRIAVDLRVEDSALRVMADPPRAQQILRALVSNAVKFTPVGSTVSVTLSTARPAEHGAVGESGPVCTWLTEPVTPVRAVYVTVRDGGPGIDPVLHREIFKPFFRASRHGIPGGGGSGLGLAIALGLVRLHGGEMWVKSKPGEGAEFGFSLPAASPTASEPVEQQ
jgi:signal transduction histidine kinase